MMKDLDYRELERLLDYLIFKINVLEHLESKSLGDRELLDNLKISRKYILKIVEGNYEKGND